MSLQINQYTKTRTSGTIQTDDLMDFDSTEDAGSTHESAKITVGQFTTYMTGNIATIYTNDGVILAPRTLTANGNQTRWLGGDVVAEMSDEVTEYGFLVKNSSSVEHARLSYEQGNLSGKLTIDNADGQFYSANNNEIRIGIASSFTGLTNVIIQGNTANTQANNINLHIKGNFSGSNNDGLLVEHTNPSAFVGPVSASVLRVMVGAVQTGSVAIVGLKVNQQAETSIGQDIVLGDRTQFVVNHTSAGIANPSSGTITAHFKNLNSRTVASLGAKTGVKITSTGVWDGLGTSVNKGLEIIVSGANKNYCAIMTGGQVGIGVLTPNVSALFHIGGSTTQGFMQDPMTAAQAAAITPAESLRVFVSTIDATFTSIGYWAYENGAWAKQ